jgi:hypothetical protein
MAQLQEVFNRIQDSKKEQKELKMIYKDALDASTQYREIVEELKVLKEKKQKIESDVRSEYHNELSKLENIKLDIKTDYELLSDLALNQLMKGETVKVADEYETEYEPIFTVKFRKA